MFTVDRHDSGLLLFGQPHYQRTRHDEAFFVGQGHRFTGFQSGPSSLQASTSDDCRKHHIDLGITDRPGNSLRADQQLDALRQMRPIDLAGLFGVGEHDPSRPESNSLLAQQINIVMG